MHLMIFASKHKLSVLGVTALLTCAILSLSGCIKNDIPYPRIQPDFVSIEAEGLAKPAEIDVVNRLVTMEFDETVDIYNIKITNYTLSEGASIVNNDLDKPVDLSKLLIVTLKLYQEYDWIIQGKQHIERYFTVENQIGETIIDEVGHRVIVTVPESAEIGHLKVLSMKLGQTNGIQTPNLTDQYINLTQPQEVKVTDFGRETTWTIYCETVEATVQTIRADAWTQVAWVYGSAIADRDNGVEYRMKGSEQWIKVNPDKVTHTGGTFCACITGLNPLTEYETRAYSDTENGAVISFTTSSIVQVPNSTLGEWNKVGKVWNPWPEGGTPYWDTGNKGATTLGESNSFPTTDTSSGTGYGAQLETRFVGIGAIGKIAAGNIFTGYFVRTEGTNGVVSMGRPFTEHPTKLHGYLKYTSVPISNTNNELTYMKGRPDTCSVWVALLDSDEPFEVRTNPNNRQLFNPQGPQVIAYGNFQSGESIPEYIPFEVEFNYVATNRRPKYIIIAASASKYGDYFTGGNGSVLFIDDLELLYDY